MKTRHPKQSVIDRFAENVEQEGGNAKDIERSLDRLLVPAYRALNTMLSSNNFHKAIEGFTNVDLIETITGLRFFSLLMDMRGPRYINEWLANIRPQIEEILGLEVTKIVFERDAVETIFEIVRHRVLNELDHLWPHERFETDAQRESDTLKRLYLESAAQKKAHFDQGWYGQLRKPPSWVK